VEDQRGSIARGFAKLVTCRLLPGGKIRLGCYAVALSTILLGVILWTEEAEQIKQPNLDAVMEGMGLAHVRLGLTP
jgi:hypothetical protein